MTTKVANEKNTKIHLTLKKPMIFAILKFATFRGHPGGGGGCIEHCVCSLPKRYTKLGLNPVFALAGVYQKLHETTHERTNEV